MNSLSLTDPSPSLSILVNSCWAAVLASASESREPSGDSVTITEASCDWLTWPLPADTLSQESAFSAGGSAVRWTPEGPAAAYWDDR